MEKKPIILLIIGIALASSTSLFWNHASLYFSAISSIVLLLVLGGFILKASLQAEAIPGIEKLEEPAFLFSQVYFTWLYVNNRKRWAKYVITVSYIVAAVYGSLLGAIACTIVMKIDSVGTFAGWAVGTVFVTLLTLGIKESRILT
ncbi:hypothetical protein KEJ15_08125 [Candidatus Bathyarchaeota archaeon]|nr:hypothetical protein [Candidatus Bathyarchaeota archaeon]